MRLSSLSSTSKTVFPFPFMRLLTADADDPIGLSVNIFAMRHSGGAVDQDASGAGVAPDQARTSADTADTTEGNATGAALPGLVAKRSSRCRPKIARFLPVTNESEYHVFRR